MKSRFIASALVLALAGCMAVKDTSGIVVEKGRLVVHNARFASHFEMQYQLRRDTPANLLHVQAFVQNADDTDFAFQYRFEWKDADGMMLRETNPSWKTATIHGKDTIALEAVGESPSAADFRLVVKPLYYR